MRAQLINDAFSLSQATLLNANLPLELVNYLSNEFEYLPWSVFLNRVKFYLDMLSSNQLNIDLKVYFSKLVEPFYVKLGWFERKINDQWLEKYVYF